MSESEIPVSPSTIEDYHSKDDSILREEVERQQKYSLTLFEPSEKARNLSDLFFFPPAKGMVTAHFEAASKHYGVDLVPTGDLFVKSTLDGTVVLADYTSETGYVIQVLHSNELLSVYKHNKQLLKKAGDIVRAGEAIAVSGNSGEISTGPHLHFELWYKGKPINPEEYIIFN
jgi:murein DD-endopeptidase MepM/ murein hydrolase activator NlpD